MSTDLPDVRAGGVFSSRRRAPRSWRFAGDNCPLTSAKINTAIFFFSALRRQGNVLTSGTWLPAPLVAGGGDTARRTGDGRLRRGCSEPHFFPSVESTGIFPTSRVKRQYDPASRITADACPDGGSPGVSTPAEGGAGRPVGLPAQPNASSRSGGRLPLPQARAIFCHGRQETALAVKDGVAYWSREQPRRSESSSYKTDRYGIRYRRRLSRQGLRRAGVQGGPRSGDRGCGPGVHQR